MKEYGLIRKSPLVYSFDQASVIALRETKNFLIADNGMKFRKYEHDLNWIAKEVNSLNGSIDAVGYIYELDLSEFKAAQAFTQDLKAVNKAREKLKELERKLSNVTQQNIGDIMVDVRKLLEKF